MAQSELTLDELKTRSLALRELLGQVERAANAVPPDQARIDALTGDDSGPAAYDLIAIWRASLADPGCSHICQHRGVESPHSRRYMSPRRYVNGWSHMVTRKVETPDGRILVDLLAAIFYCKLADSRVFQAVIAQMNADREEAARRDPIGAAVASARGGGLAMMFARLDAQEILGLDGEEFDRAVLARARSEAETMGDYAAERLLSEVRRAIEEGPRLEFVELAS